MSVNERDNVTIVMENCNGTFQGSYSQSNLIKFLDTQTFYGSCFLVFYVIKNCFLWYNWQQNVTVSHS